MRLIFIFLVIFCKNLQAQQINACAKVTAISGKVLTLSNIDETFHTFTAGENIIIMQMQDNVIGSNTSDNSSFGNLNSILSAGLYDFHQIQSRTASTITLATNLSQTYNINANSVVQIISFRKYGSPNYTTTANMSAKAWDGNTGGVLAMDVAGTLTLAHSLSADGAGFRGGAASSNSSSGCNGTTFLSTSTAYGSKGEGIYPNNASYTAGKGKILNGGGGANDGLNGGGGGGNYTAGGNGGGGYFFFVIAFQCGTSSGGLGGLGLSSNITSSRIFMGGGGGGGQQDNSSSTSGGNGGGIILLRANSIQSTGTCTLSISANGASSFGSANDGAGGGGAGGSIVIQANTWSIGGSCPLTVSANGGNGGSGTNYYGGGGGGGQGAIFYSSNQPLTNVTTQTNNGSSGCNIFLVVCLGSAPAPSGTNNSGIVQNSAGPLPIELFSFDCEVKENSVNIQWITLSEVNNQYFSIERSTDGLIWNELKIIPGSGTKNIPCTYQWVDSRPLNGISYYRLKQVDMDGKYSYSMIRGVEVVSQGDFILFPNPVEDHLEIRFPTNLEEITIEIMNYSGQMIGSYTLRNQNLAQIDLSRLDNGVYFARIKTNREEIIKKFIKGL